MMSSAFRTPRRVTPAYTSLNRRYSFYFGMLFILFIGFQVYALLSLGNSPPTSSDQSQSNRNNEFTALDLQSNAKKGEGDRTKPIQPLKPIQDNSGTVFFRTDTISQTHGYEPPVPNAIPSPKNPIRIPPSRLPHSTDSNQVSSKHAKPSQSPTHPSKDPSPDQSLQQMKPSSQPEPTPHTDSILSKPVSVVSDSTEVTETEKPQTVIDIEAGEVPSELETAAPTNSTVVLLEDSDQSHNQTSATDSTITMQEEISVENVPVNISEDLPADNSTTVASNATAESPKETSIVSAPKPDTPSKEAANKADMQPEERSQKNSSPQQPIDWNTYTLPLSADEIALKEISDWLKANNKEVKILFWDKISGFMGKHMLRLPARCDIPCSFTENQEEYNSSTAVVFHIPNFLGFPTYTVPDQLWVAYSMESEQYYRKLQDPKFMSHFNLTMTYKLSSDIIASYFNSNVTYYMTPPYSKNETGYALAAFVASNCVLPRVTYVQDLAKYIQVDSYGKCIHNKNFPDLNISNGGLLKFHTMKRHKFYLAFENHEAEDYVTEKFFHAIAAGTVPVYWGAPNIAQFIPHNHSVINVKDFESPEQLANYLKYLDENPIEYERYLEWKKTGPSQQFLDLISRQKLDARCRLCIRAAQQLRQVEERASSLPSDVQ